MNQQTLVVHEQDSKQANLGKLIITCVRITAGGVAKAVVGRPGLQNLKAEMEVGDAVLFEAPEGLFEIRFMKTDTFEATFLLTQLSPSPGIMGGIVDKDPENSPFTPTERAKIASSLEEVRSVIRERTDVPPEQFDFISRKLDEMYEASERLGKKDWMNLAIGTLTSVIVTASLESSVAKALLSAAGAALSWVFGSVLRLL